MSRRESEAFPRNRGTPNLQRGGGARLSSCDVSAAYRMARPKPAQLAFQLCNSIFLVEH